jgi:DNA-binding response OmpR family regulator
MHRIALVEDDLPTSNDLRKLLETVPNTVVEVTQLFNYDSAVAAIKAERFDLLVVDIELGSQAQEHHKGLSILADHGRDCPTIIVTGMPEENLGPVAFTLRAYDFIPKPVDELKFQHRVSQALSFASNNLAALARAPGGLPPGLTPDPNRSPQLRWKDKRVSLTLTELKIVNQLAGRAGSVVPHSDLAQAMKTGDNKSLAVHMSQIRRKFSDVDPSFNHIETAPGKGYFWSHGS